MLKLLQRASSLTPPDAACLEIFGQRWTVVDYPSLSDAPPFTCISYAWEAGKVENPLAKGQWMSARTLPALQAAIAVTHSDEVWARNVQFSYKREADKEAAGRQAAIDAAQAIWIDALCVPVEEPARSACLKDMGRIFSAAFQVVVVLAGAASGVLRVVSQSADMDDATLLALENDSWIRRAWTYQEAVNSRAMYFLVEGDQTLLVAGQDFLRSIGDGIDGYKSRHALGDVTWLKTFPGLSGLEVLLADYRIADYSDRSAYQVMAVMGQRVSERPEDHFYAMVGAITGKAHLPPEDDAGDPAEHFMQACTQKGDFSFIYATAPRSKEPGRGWRPVAARFSAVLPGLNIFGSGEPGLLATTHIDLQKMSVPIPGTPAGDGLKAALRFIGRPDEGMSSSDIAAAALEKMRALGFTGCGDHLEFESGFFFPQNRFQSSEDLRVVLSGGVWWQQGGPGLLVRSNGTELDDFCDVGAFIGREPKSWQSIRLR